ncbi:DUF2637 domain-containing protein [Streptomyces spinosirectus]
MTTTPAGTEPKRPTANGHTQPTAPGTPHLPPLTRTQKILTGIVVGAVLIIATLGFIGSYSAVTELAQAKHFGRFAHAFPIAVDAGIIAFLALDLLLTWRRIAFPLLRYTAWGLTAATIAFNAATAWPDKLGVGMHGVIPILFVIAVEAARHAIGRMAAITADKHIEGPNPSRWLLNPVGTFVLWRRQRLWQIRRWDTVLTLERERRIYVAQLRKDHGRAWRRKASAEQMLVLSLAKDGMSIADATALPEREARKLAEAQEAEAEAKHQTELRNAEAEAKRRAELAEAEAAEARARAEAEAAAEALRLEAEANRRREAEAARLLVAETEAKLAELARQRREAEAEAELNRQRRAAEQARLADEAARRRREQADEEARQRRQQEANERAQQIASRATTVSASAPKRATTSGSASGSVSPIGGRGAKKQAEVEAVLARLVEANDPKAYPLSEVIADFGLSQTTAYDRLSTAQSLFAEAAKSKSEKSA